ncbi:hypothetical protein DR73_785 [Enterobacteriaceae bacterium ATCC 29904]|nr:hypothetical protein DR73_785 [Enterobacteriaceae bacterium ATCC 29904]
MNDSLNNKELVVVGHHFAKAMSSDTPIIDMAKIVSRLAERLDCTTAALREMTKQRDALAAENAGLKESRKNLAEFIHEELDAEYPLNMKIETPATDSFLAEVRAQAKADGVQEYADSFRHSASKIRECHGDTIRVRALLHEANNADEFAAKLRKGGAA